MVFEMELFVAVVNNVKLVTIAIDSSFLVVRYPPLIIVIIVICYSDYLQWWVIHNIISKMKTLVRIMVTISYWFI